MEKMFGFHTHSSNGVKLIWGMGQLESELTMSLGQLVVDNEIVNYSKRYQRGYEVNEETLQYDQIKEVGISGSFLDTDYTLENFREHFYAPTILNRKAKDDSSEPLEVVAAKRAQKIIAADTEEKMTQDESTEIRKIEADFRARIA